MEGLLTASNIVSPKTRVNTSLTGYRITALARSPNTKTTEVGWQVYRTNTDTGEVDWARNAAGNNSDDYEFKANDLANLVFTE